MDANLSDLIFWAACFFQESQTTEGKRGDISYFLPEDGAKSIADCLSGLGFDISPETVKSVYENRI